MENKRYGMSIAHPHIVHPKPNTEIINTSSEYNIEEVIKVLTEEVPVKPELPKFLKEYGIKEIEEENEHIDHTSE
jgi:TusA-related sulfurtransferase